MRSIAGDRALRIQLPGWRIPLITAGLSALAGWILGDPDHVTQHGSAISIIVGTLWDCLGYTALIWPLLYSIVALSARRYAEIQISFAAVSLALVLIETGSACVHWIMGWHIGLDGIIPIYLWILTAPIALYTAHRQKLLTYILCYIVFVIIIPGFSAALIAVHAWSDKIPDRIISAIAPIVEDSAYCLSGLDRKSTLHQGLKGLNIYQSGPFPSWHLLLDVSNPTAQHDDYYLWSFHRNAFVRYKPDRRGLIDDRETHVCKTETRFLEQRSR